MALQRPVARCSGPGRGLVALRITCCLLTLTMFVPALIGQRLMVMNFQPDGVPRTDTKALYNDTLNKTISSFTMCYRFNLHYLHYSAGVVKLEDSATGNDENLIGIMFINRIRTYYNGHRIFQPLKHALTVGRWHHLCLMFDHTAKEISSYVDGQLNFRNEFNMTTVARGDSLWLGQGSKIDITGASASFSGLLTQVNIWDYILTRNEISEIASCSKDSQGNYVAWNNGWTTYNVDSYEEELSVICQVDGSVKTYQWFPFMNQEDAYYLCHALGGKLPEISSLQDARGYYDLAAKSVNNTNCRTSFWTAFTDAEVEGVWRDGTDPEDVVPMLWAKREPDGFIYQNCALIYYDGYRDIACAGTLICAFCEFMHAVAFSMRGSCEIDARNTYFSSVQEEIGKIKFQGYGGYQIGYENNSWVWREQRDGAIIGIMKKNRPNYPMGRRTWNIYRPMCGQEPGSRVLLLTPCSDAQFSCDDAKCVPAEKRCDMKYDCLDHSDELNCTLINFPVGYQHDLPPRQVSKNDSFLPIVANVTMKSISIDTMLMTMFVSYEFKMSWIDPRLSYVNLKLQTSLNVLSSDIVDMLWSPAVAFANTDGGYTTEVDIKTIMFITRLGSTTGRDEGAPGEVELFSGAQNILSITRNYGVAFTCDFDLMLYPFDSQLCDMVLQMSSASSAYIQFDLNNSIVTYLGNPLLLEYEMQKPALYLDTGLEYSQLHVRVFLSRRYGYPVLNIYIPSSVLMAISYVTMHFQAHIFEVRVMSVLTVLLVTATLFTQVSSSLPKTSYFKMVDIWLLFCIVMNFILILVHAAVDYTYHVERSIHGGSTQRVHIMAAPETKALRSRWVEFDQMENPKKLIFNLHLKQLDRLSKVSVVTIFVIFCVFYWGFIVFKK